MTLQKSSETASIASCSTIFGTLYTETSSSSNLSDTDRTFNADYNDSTMDLELSKVLLSEVVEVSRCASATQRSFDKVSDILLALKCSGTSEKEAESLWSQWDSLRMRFSNLLLRTRGVSSTGAQMIEDFLNNFGPFLSFTNVSVIEKLEEIERYRKVIETSEERTAAIALESDLQRLRADFDLFGESWSKFKADRSRYSDSLEKSIAIVQSSLNEMKKLFLRLLVRTSLEVGAGCVIIATGIAAHNILPIIAASPPVLKGVCEDAIGSHKAFKTIRNLRKSIQVKKLQRTQEEKRILPGRDALATCKAQLLSLDLKLDIFPRFWSVILSDLKSLQSLLDSARSTTDMKNFNFHVDAIMEFYKHVQIAFHQYARDEPSLDLTSVARDNQVQWWKASRMAASHTP